MKQTTTHLTIIAALLSTCLAANAAPTSLALFRSSGNPLQYSGQVDTIANAGGWFATASPELSEGALPGDWGDYWIPTHSGTNVIRIAGASTGPNALCAMDAYSVHIPISAKTKLSYWLFPQMTNAAYIGVDLHCTDGTLLSGTDAVDQNGAKLDPAAGHGGIDVRKWSRVESQIGKWLAGKTIDKVLVSYRSKESLGQFRGYVDDIVITDGAVPSSTAIASTHALPAPAWSKSGSIYCVSEKQFSTAGDLRGIDMRLGKLKDLHVSAIWLMPINTIGTYKAIGSPYCTSDYFAIDPRFGTADDLVKLVTDAHKLDIKVVLDEALDHTSWDNILITKHPEWYRHEHDDPAAPISRTPYWGDVAQLDYSKPELRDYMVQMLKYWVKTYDIDGFRFDSAELTPTEFWNQTSTALREVKPDILLLGESHRPEMMVAGMNADYSFTVYEAMKQVLHQKAPVSFIADIWREEQAMFPVGTTHMRYVGNQDTDKPAKEYGVDASRAAAVLMWALDGVPLLYNGMEVDDTTSGHFLDNGKIDWSKDTVDDTAFSFYSHLAQMRPDWTGTVKWVPNDHPDKLLTFTRTEGKNQIFVAVNLSADPLPASTLKLDYGAWKNISPANSASPGAPPSFDNRPYGYVVYSRK